LKAISTELLASLFIRNELVWKEKGARGDNCLGSVDENTVWSDDDHSDASREYQEPREKRGAPEQEDGSIGGGSKSQSG